jgi:hypothetical protein
VANSLEEIAMPPITPTLQVDSTVMTNNWSGGLANPTNQQKLVYKYTHPKKLFNADPQGAQTAFQTGVTRAIAANKYANGMAKADTNKAADNMTNYGGANWSTAGTTKKYKYAAVAPALAAAINTVLSTVSAMPKGRGGNNQARMNAWFTGMSGFYGKIK